jgi:phage shock protein E
VVAAGIGLLVLWRARASVDSGEARRLVEQGALLLDVRTPAEFAGGHLEGAVNLPVDQISRRGQELDRARPVVVYCRSGARSAAAARSLRSLGVERVEDLGAMSNW